MSNAAQPSLLRRLMGAAAVRPPEIDPADMGTAIGLDFCLDEGPADPALTAAAPARLGTASGGWLRRLASG
jgi:hypothetical protein